MDALLHQIEKKVGRIVASIKQEITILKTLKFGRAFYYPGCPISNKFCKLLGQVSLTPENMKDIEAIGYSIMIQNVKHESEFPS